MHREVFGDVEDGFEELDVVALDFTTLQEKRRIQMEKRRVDFIER